MNEILKIAKTILDENIDCAKIHSKNGIYCDNDGWETENYIEKSNLSDSLYTVRRLGSAHNGCFLFTLDLSKQKILNISTVKNDDNFIVLTFENFDIYIDKNKKIENQKEKSKLSIQIYFLNELLKNKSNLDYVELPIKVFRNYWIIDRDNEELKKILGE